MTNLEAILQQNTGNPIGVHPDLFKQAEDDSGLLTIRSTVRRVVDIVSQLENTLQRPVIAIAEIELDHIRAMKYRREHPDCLDAAISNHTAQGAQINELREKLAAASANPHFLADNAEEIYKLFS